MLTNAVSPTRLNYLAHAIRHARRRMWHDVVLLGDRVADGEVIIEDGLTGFPFAPNIAIPTGSFAAIVPIDVLTVWLRERGVAA